MNQKDLVFFEERIMKTYTYLIKYITALSKDPVLAADVVQDTMETALKQIDRIKSYSNVKKALERISKNILLNYYKKHEPEIYSVEVEEGNSEYDSAAILLQNEDRRHLLIYIDLLREDYSRIILLHYYYGMTFKDIADALSLNYNTVISWHRRALIQLKRVYKSDD